MATNDFLYGCATITVSHEFVIAYIKPEQVKLFKSDFKYAAKKVSKKEAKGWKLYWIE